MFFSNPKKYAEEQNNKRSKLDGNKKKSDYIKTTSICLFASELACLIGLNTYKKPSETILRIWQKNFTTDFKRTKKRLEEDDEEEELALIETRNEKFSRISNKLDTKKKEEVKITMEKCLEAKDVNSMINLRKDVLKECEELPNKDRKEILDTIYDITNTNFGTKNENKSVHIYTQMTGEPVIKIEKFMKRMIFKAEGYEWFIGGKVDGILKDNTIIEVKNRMYKLFREVREYEKIQTYAYMFALYSKKSQLVETYMNGKAPEVNIMDVEFEQIYWDYIVNRILIFINYFNKFMKSKKLKRKMLVEGADNYDIDIFD